MDTAEFAAIAVSNEINISTMARHFGINRKFKWEEYLALKEDALKGVIRQPENKRAYIFSFGSMVFVNCQPHEIIDILLYLKKDEKNLNTTAPFTFSDQYRLEIEPGQPAEVHNDFMVTPQTTRDQQAMIATILAKSVALEKIETDIGLLLDEIEAVVNNLHYGRLSVSDSRLAKLSARILGFKFNTISYLMLLDKPDITWSNPEAAALYNELAAIFELEERYQIIRHKTDILMDITEVFTGLVHARRGNRLEWAVIVLIAIEIGLSLYSMFFAR